MKYLLRALAVLVLATMGGCAYYNALYNAQRAFEEAERHALEGRSGVAASTYSTAVQKAKRSYERDKDGRWADDALLLIARAQFGRGSYTDVHEPLRALLEFSRDASMRAQAHAYLGAAQLRLGRPESAAVHLDSALASPSPARGFASLWRARSRRLSGDTAGAMADLKEAFSAPGRTGIDARLEQINWAMLDAQPASAAEAFGSLLADPRSRGWTDSLRSLITVSAARWGADEVRRMTAAALQAPWPGAARDSLLLFRAALAAEAGDYDVAEAEARALASGASTGVADLARLANARWQVQRAETLADLGEARSLLVSAVGNQEAVDLVRGIRVVGVLIERAERNGQALGLFAAAEHARDQLRAPALARRLFIAYADMVPEALWAPKALLAAAALEPTESDMADIRERLDRMSGSVYVAAVRGGVAEGEFVSAEERLQRSLAALVSQATTDASRRDALVEGAVASLDSIRANARTDSLKLRCGGILDSLAFTGILADTVRAVCMRGQPLNIDSLLASDTLRPRRRGRDDLGDSVPRRRVPTDTMVY